MLAVLLGVAFVAGTYVFTDTLQRTFTELFDQQQPDVVVTAATEVESLQATSAAGSLPAAALDVVSRTDGAATAAGSVTATGVTLIDPQGEAVGTVGPPTLGVSWIDEPALSQLTIVEGVAPSGRDEIAVDSESFADAGFALGDEVRIITPGPTVKAELVGVFRFGTGGNLAGATLTAFAPERAQRLLLGGDRWTELVALAEDGVSQDQLAEDVRAAFAEARGPGLRGLEVDVQTGEELQDEISDAINEGLSFFTTFLLVFAAVSLFVGGFIIVNTFSVLIARRTRELALLRAVGASRRQVTASVLLEALLVGLIGGILGLVLGVLLAVALRALIGAVGLDLPDSSLVVAPRTVLVALLLGVALTMVAAWVPARRAGRIPPVAALRDDVVLPARSLRLRSIIGGLLLLLGAGLLSIGLLVPVSNAITFVGAGILAVFIGVVLLAAVVGGAVLRVLGAPLSRTTVGRLALRNAQRDRRRTAATAGALMVGLALVTTIGVLGSSATASVETTIQDTLTADYLVTSRSFEAFTPEVAQAVGDVPGVEIVSSVGQSPVLLGEPDTDGRGGQGQGRRAGEEQNLSFAVGVDPTTLAAVLVVDELAGSLNSLSAGAVAMTQPTAESLGVGVDDQVTVTWPSGPQQYRLGAVLAEAGQLSGVIVDRQEFARVGVPDLDSALYVVAEDRTSAGDLRPALEAALADFPTVQLLDQTEVADQVRDQVGQLLNLVYGLLGLAVVIAVLGIVNTLALSVLERTREIGLLRAVGTSRQQVGRMIRIEAVLIALFGAVLGVVLGLAFGVAIQRALAEDGIAVLGIPWPLLAVVFAMSALAGLAAAILPARRAARLDVLGAIATE